jgi:hypothetical protein
MALERRRGLDADAAVSAELRRGVVGVGLGARRRQPEVGVASGVGAGGAAPCVSSSRPASAQLLRRVALRDFFPSDARLQRDGGLRLSAEDMGLTLEESERRADGWRSRLQRILRCFRAFRKLYKSAYRWLLRFVSKRLVKLERCSGVLREAIDVFESLQARLAEASDECDSGDAEEDEESACSRVFVSRMRTKSPLLRGQRRREPSEERHSRQTAQVNKVMMEFDRFHARQASGEERAQASKQVVAAPRQPSASRVEAKLREEEEKEGASLATAPPAEPASLLSLPPLPPLLVSRGLSGDSDDVVCFEPPASARPGIRICVEPLELSAIPIETVPLPPLGGRPPRGDGEAAEPAPPHPLSRARSALLPPLVPRRSSRPGSGEGGSHHRHHVLGGAPSAPHHHRSASAASLRSSSSARSAALSPLKESTALCSQMGLDVAFTIARAESPAHTTAPQRSLEVRQMIGAGAFSRVFYAVDSFGHPAALKRFQRGPRGEPRERTLALIRNEISLLAEARHPNIVAFLGVVEDAESEGDVSLAMEFVRGGNLQDAIDQVGPLDERVASRITRQVLEGLAYLHERHIIHRDIKPRNLMLAEPLEAKARDAPLVKIADFGTAADMRTNALRHSCVGTAMFCAPEVLRSEDGYSFAADVWSLGCCLFNMAMGRPPHSECDHNVQVMFKVVSLGAPPPDTYAHLGPELRDFLDLCWRRDWRARPSAPELLSHSFISKWRDA